jgi:hypothetical protein
MYDGTVGVLGGLEAIRALARSGYRPRRSIDLITFTSEEPTRFGIGCLCSRLMAGVLNASADESLIDKEGKTLNELRPGRALTAPVGGSAMAWPLFRLCRTSYRAGSASRKEATGDRRGDGDCRAGQPKD